MGKFDPTTINDVEYRIQSADVHIVSWKTQPEGFRWHIWLYRSDKFKPTDTLYKNSPHHYGTQGYFEPKKLDPDAKINKPMVDHVFAYLAENGLIEAAKVKLAEKEAKEAAEQAEAIRINKIALQLFPRLRDFIANTNQGTYMIDRDDIKAILMYAPSAEHFAAFPPEG